MHQPFYPILDWRDALQDFFRAYPEFAEKQNEWAKKFELLAKENEELKNQLQQEKLKELLPCPKCRRETGK